MNKKKDLTQIKNRLKELAKLIKLHNEHYHQNDKPIISDGEFDKLINENSHLEKKYPDLIIINGPNDTIGSKLKNKFNKIFNLSDDDLENNNSYKEYKNRLNHELSIIIEMKYSSYFLIVADYIKWAKNNDIPVGPGRGSGAGSLVAWCLSITDVDPIKFNLIFERFLNPDRISMPDFDIDSVSYTHLTLPTKA